MIVHYLACFSGTSTGHQNVKKIVQGTDGSGKGGEAHSASLVGGVAYVSTPATGSMVT